MGATRKGTSRKVRIDPPASDCPKDIIEVRRNEDGTLDEIVAGDSQGDGVFVHLEQMDTNCWWLAVYHKGHRQVVWFSARGKITATSDMDDWPDETAK